MTEQEIIQQLENQSERYRRDRAHIAALAAGHNADLHRWCYRRRRYETFRRVAVATCLLVGCCLSYSSSVATPLYDQITTTSEEGNQHICETIRLAIEKA